MKTKIYRTVSVEDRLPNGDFEGMFIDQFGTWSKNRYDFDSTFEKESCLRTNKFWLEEIEIPTEESIRQFANDLAQDDVYTTEQEIEAYVDGASFILNHIKGGE